MPTPLVTAAPHDAPATPAPLLQVKDLHIDFAQPRPAVEGISLTVGRGEVVALVGESGSGKTTLGRTATGLLRAAAGVVRLDGTDLASLTASELRAVRRGLAVVPQDPAASLDPRYTVGRSIAEPLEVHGVGDARTRTERVRELLASVHLDQGLVDRRPAQLSGGQRQRVALARALALEPRLLVADEPTSALDVSIQAEVLELFSRLQRELGFACLFVSHDLAVVHQVSDRVVVLRDGRVVEQGPVGRVFARPEDPYTRRLVESVPDPDPARARRRVAS